MLSAVKDIGKLIIEREGRDLLSILVEDPDSNGSYKKVITIVLEQKDNGFKFAGVETEEYDSGKKMKYLYRSGAANGADLSPTAKLSGKPEGTFDRKILGWFNILDDKKTKLTDAEKIFLNGIRDVLKENAGFIKREILTIREKTPKKEGIVVTLKIKNQDLTKYVGDFPVFREFLKKQVNDKAFSISAANKMCSICGEKKATVFGNLDTYAFYTLDKPGYITGGFDEAKAWRNFPVCPECKLALEEGKKFVESNLTFKFCGIRYNLIPKFILGEYGISDEIIDIFTNTSRIVSLKQKVMERIANDDEEILDVLKDLNDVITLNFLFIQKSNAAERILLNIEDVFPSRIRKIFDIKHEVDYVYNSNFTFGTIRNFFSKSDPNKRDYDLDGYFLDIVDRIFKDRPVSFYFVLQFIMKKIRDEFINDRYFYLSVRNGMMSVSFLEKLELIKMEEDIMEESIFDGMFKKYGPAFETPLKRGLFLLGSLTELLLRKQYKERSSKPFMKNLKSLKMSERDFKSLLPEVQNKLEEYDSFDKGKRMLAAEASNYLLQAGDNWKMPVDEMNFYFACGMNLVNDVADIIYPDKKVAEQELGQEEANQ
jgi:CRISPR-associated protein Csh1